MAEDVRILLLADSEREATWLTSTLCAGDYTPTCLRVADEASCRAHLEQEAWDLVVAAMTEGGGPAALGAVRDRISGVDPPLVLLVDRFEDGAETALRLGATVCLRGAGLGQLGPAVERARRERPFRTERPGGAAFEEGQREVLESIAMGTALAEVLEQIVLLIERQGDGMLCSILLLDRDGARVRHGAAPHLPRQLVEGIDGAAIGPEEGSCGAAAYLRRSVIVEDIATHPNWRSYRQLVIPFGLRACWSTPILSAHGVEVLGTFAMYYREPRPPTARERHWVTRATHLASIAIARDRAEQTARQADARLSAQAALLDKAKDAILVMDLDGAIRYWNRGAERLYGWSAAEAIGRRVRDLIHADTATFDAARRQMMADGEWTGQLPQVDKAGQPIITEVSATVIRDDQGQPASIFAIGTDITERKRLEAQVFHIQRLDSLGTLASGIAHDFNNLLAAILGNVALALREVPMRDPARELLVEVELAGKRGADLVRQLLTFGRLETPQRQPLKLQPLVDEALRLLRATLPKTLQVEPRLSEDAPAILADPTQIHQIVMNLGTNAAHAMNGNGGTIDVQVERVVLDRTLDTHAATLRPGTYARLVVADNGCGIEPESLDRIFDPFFTTKEPGQGTGLGLSVVHGIVGNHEGGITVRSTPGQGTEFSVYFPAAPPEGRPSPRP